MSSIPPGVLQAQAQAQAPGQTMGPQAKPDVAKGRKQSKGGKGQGKADAPNPAQSLYPNLPTTGG